MLSYALVAYVGVQETLEFASFSSVVRIFCLLKPLDYIF